MVRFEAILKKFAEQGEKTGWTYLQVPSSIADKLQPGMKKSFRVKGKLDHHPIAAVALVPMGEGNFILAVNASMRKAIKKQKGDKVVVQLQCDKAELVPPPVLIQCLKDEPAAFERYEALNKSHKNYYARWVKEAKTEATRAKRIAAVVTGLTRGSSFAEVLRSLKKQNEDLGF